MGGRKVNDDDSATPEENIASSLRALYDALALAECFTFPMMQEMVIAATPEITKYYLKGQ